MFNKRLLILASICLIVGVLAYYSFRTSAVDGIKVPEIVSYNYDVRPILSDKCFSCHGPDAKKREAGLRLDLESEAYKALQEHPSKHALVPGKPELSEVFQRITTTDSSLVMPVASSKLPRLTENEIAIIKKWIEQGAK